jgi:hypothetical protein
MRRIFFGLVWLVVFYFGSLMVVGAIAGGQAAALAQTPQEARDVAVRAAEAAAKRYFHYISSGSVALALFGTLLGFLPGTRPSEDRHERMMNRSHDPHRYATRLAVLSGVALVIAVLAGLVYNEWSQRQPLSPLKAERFGDVRVGMTLEQVEAVLGLPPGDYSGGGSPTITFTHSHDHQTWLGTAQGLTVFFDKAGRVTERRAYLVHRPSRSARAR